MSFFFLLYASIGFCGWRINTPFGFQNPEVKEIIKEGLNESTIYLSKKDTSVIKERLVEIAGTVAFYGNIHGFKYIEENEEYFTNIYFHFIKNKNSYKVGIITIPGYVGFGNNYKGISIGINAGYQYFATQTMRSNIYLACNIKYLYIWKKLYGFTDTYDKLFLTGGYGCMYRISKNLLLNAYSGVGIKFFPRVRNNFPLASLLKDIRDLEDRNLPYLFIELGIAYKINKNE